MNEHSRRDDLGVIEGDRTRFSATFERTGTKQGKSHYDVTALLLNVTHVGTGTVVTDHLWFAWNQGLNAMRPLAEGDVLEFDARVVQYNKGRRRDGNRRVDWKLSHPTKWDRVIESKKHADETEIRRQSRPDANKAKKRTKR